MVELFFFNELWAWEIGQPCHQTKADLRVTIKVFRNYNYMLYGVSSLECQNSDRKVMWNY